MTDKSSTAKPGVIGAAPPRLPADIYLRVFEASPDPITLQAFPEGRFLAVNAAFERTFRSPRGSTLGQTMLDVGLIRDAAAYQDLVRQVGAAGEVINIEMPLTARDGTVVSCHVSASLMDVDGRRCMLTVIGDIRMQKRIEAALRYSNAVLQAISSAQSKSLADADPQQVFADMLTDLLRITGSSSGVIAEVLQQGDGQPTVRPLAVRGDHDARSSGGGVGALSTEQPNPASLTAFCSQALLSGRAVLGEQAAERGSRPALFPAQTAPRARMALPLHHAGKLIGVAAVAGGPEPYDEAVVAQLESFLNTCGALIDFLHTQRERERIEKILRDNQAMLAGAQRLANLGSWESDLINLTDTETNPLRWSDQTYRIFGFEPGEIALDSESFSRCVHPDDRQRVREADATALQSANQASVEYRIVRPDGAIRHVEEVYEIVRDPRTGAPVRIVGAVRDITAQKLAEEQLQLAAQVFESSHEAMMITDAARNVVAVNRAFARITGYTAEETVGNDAGRIGAGRAHESMEEEIWNAVNRTGYWQGELWARRKTGESYAQSLSVTAICDQDGTIKNYIWVAEDITERRRAQEHIHYLAHYDALTELPNRALLRDRLGQALTAAGRKHAQVAVLFMDLDRFKTINDSLGHHVGDQLLKGMASRLRGAVREVDTIARLGGDEFIVVLPDTGEEGAEQVAAKLRSVIAEPLHIDRHTLTVTPSIGISVYPQHGQDFDALIRNADAALYHAKDHGRNRHQFFSNSMSTAALERIALESGLRVALDRRQLQLHYQPQIDARSGRVVGVEALVRWNHPEWGQVPPGQFIPVAEDSGLIVPIGRWILEEACRQNYAWQQAGVPAIRIGVNLSALQFRQSDFQNVVRAALTLSKLPPHFLELELTESILMRDVAQNNTDLLALSELGVQFAVDDFGTGYSSLSYLKRFPIDRLKVDRSFIRNVTTDADDAAIVRAVISLAHSMQMSVIAEGVETREQFDFLLAEGCDQVQGHYFARPMAAEQLLPLLRAGSPPDTWESPAATEHPAGEQRAPALRH